jgi:uncharacterized OB-fold protein
MNQASITSDVAGRMTVTSAQVARTARGIALLGARCTRCARIAFPVLFACPHCGCEESVSAPVPSSGKLYVHTRVHIAGPGIKVPYVVGYVDVADGVRLFAQIEAEFDQLRAGDELELVIAETKKRGRYQYAFRSPASPKNEQQ